MKYKSIEARAERARRRMKSTTRSFLTLELSGIPCAGQLNGVS